MATTKAQTGLSIARNDNEFSFSWKLAETYSYQQYRARTSNQPVPARTNIGEKVTTGKLTINKNNFYPFTKTMLSFVAFSVRARALGKDGKLKDWSESINKEFAIDVPYKPSLQAIPSDSLGNSCTFEWRTTNDTSSKRILTDVEFQTMLVKDSNTNDGSILSWNSGRIGWQSGARQANNSITITENSSNIANGSHTRWFRVRSRGPAGTSEWKYAKRVYAVPNAPTIKSIKSTKTVGGWQELVKWTSPASYAYPAELNTLEYLVTIPDAGLSVPAGSMWSEAVQINRTAASNSGLVLYNSEIPEDNVLFVRVTATHVLAVTPSQPVIAQIGNLASPEITEIITNNSTYKATITVNNKSQVTDSFVVIMYRTASNPNKTSILGVVPAGSSTITVQCPNWSKESGFAFGVYAAVGSWKNVTRSDGVSSAAVTVKMRSSGEVWNDGDVPKAPSTVTASPTGTEGTVQLEWDWPWNQATSAILSWADHEDAWQSTEEPSDYEVTNINAAQWNIAGLETGKRWWFRVRLKKEDSEGATLGPWSEAVVVDLSSAPMIPALTLSNSVITADGSVTAYWGYTSTDGTAQSFAEICEATITSSGITYGRVIAETESAQHIILYAQEVGWNTGETHYLCVRVVSASGIRSDGWSDPVPVAIAEPIYATISTSSLVDEEIDGRTVKALKAMPLTATVTGAGAGGTTSLIIERAEDYHVDRPDETDFYGFEGETIAKFTQTGENEITIEREDLIGLLDDGARYRLIGIVQDGLGQYDEESIDFEVHWTDQAIIPEATAYIKDTVAVISPIAPQGTGAGATCDIYRLSSDKPELIVKGGQFGEVYVDPYPTIGKTGGHRIVYLTADGDYITEEEFLAWYDLGESSGDYLDVMHSIIDFDGEQIELFYDTSQGNNWEKDFKETRYLGGSVQGDWNRPVGRTASFDVSFVTLEDEAQIRAMRRLAAYPGLCHIRTLDGSSFDCDIQVSESRDYGDDRFRAEFSLSITRVDSQELNGQLYSNYFVGE